MSGNPNFSVGSTHFTTASCIVFVGNIPYGLAENQLTEIFKSVGRVVCFRMVFDRETGRSKGYGFAEYIDAETAASAVRNLDGYEIMGRKLRVDYSSQGYVGKEGYPGRDNAAKDTAAAAAAAAANKDRETMYPMSFSKDPDYNDLRSSYSADAGYSAHSGSHNGGSDNGRFGIQGFTDLGGGGNGSDHPLSARFGPPNLTSVVLSSSPTGEAPVPPAALAAFLGSLPQGVDNHPSLSTTDSISKTLSQIPAPQLLLALGQMKELIATDPVKATETLRHCPQLGHALFQAMILMNLVKPEVVSQILETGAAPTTTYTNNNPQQQQLQMGMVAGNTLPQQQQFQQNLIQQQYLLQQRHMRQTTPQQQQQQANFYNNYQAQQSALQNLNLNLVDFPPSPEFMVNQQQQLQMQIQAAQAAQAQAAQQMQAQGVPQAQDGAEEKALLLQRVKLLTQEEISRLPAEQAQQVMLLKHKLMTEGIAGQAGF